MTTPHTPSAEAVEAAARKLCPAVEPCFHCQGEALDALTAALPHLRRQIVEGCVEAVSRDTKVAVDVGKMTNKPATPVEMRAIAIGALRALLGDASTREEGKDA